MKIDLGDRAALLVGSGGPIAKAVAAALIENGAGVKIARFEAFGHKLVGTDPLLAPADISEHPAPGLGSFGKPWLLVAIHPGAEQLPADDHPFGAEWDSTRLRTLVRAFAPDVRRVVSVISVAGVVPLRANPVFSAGQASLASMTRALAMELGGAGISVNAVAVGAVGEAVAAGANLMTHTALKRPARLSEIVAAVLFLADPDNTYTTGHVAIVDGGFAAGYARNF
jgi:NAD(P)-dependent dehydrogenase (short-subunit alcohol dehydrogenase family)